MNAGMDEYMTELTDWRKDGPTNSLTDRLEKLTANWLIEFTDRLSDWRTNWLSVCLSVCLTDWLTDRQTETDGWTDWRIDWLTKNLTDWLFLLSLTDRPTDWLSLQTDWRTNKDNTNKPLSFIKTYLTSTQKVTRGGKTNNTIECQNIYFPSVMTKTYPFVGHFAHAVNAH